MDSQVDRKQEGEDLDSNLLPPRHRETTTKDPRHLAKTLSLRQQNTPASLRTAASMFKNKGYNLSQWKRQEISTRDIRSQFEIVHTIDNGQGQIGGMNGGVFVVCIKGRQDKLYIEKRFKDGDVAGLGEIEIKMLKNLVHSSLTSYHAAFITPDIRSASVYVEFCDRGSLEDLMKQYVKHRDDDPMPMIPEGFVWHAFVGLCDGLAYLQGGKSVLRQPDRNPVRGWIPILHRDIKPDNVLLRSRSQIGSNKYFYCILSDFGLACEDRLDSDPRVNKHQKSRTKLGTSTYYAPELLWSPYPGGDSRRPKPSDENHYFPGSNKHTIYSDLWALGACIHNLCMCSVKGSTSPNINWDEIAYSKLDPGIALQGTISRYKELSIPDETYTPQLKAAVKKATIWDVTKRPNPVKMVKELELYMKAANFETQKDSEALPGWSTRVHQYFSVAENLSKRSSGR